MICEVPQRSIKSIRYSGDLKIPRERDGVSTGSYCSKIKCTPKPTTLDNSALGYSQAFMLRDPDGHADNLILQ